MSWWDWALVRLLRELDVSLVLSGCTGQMADSHLRKPKGEMPLRQPTLPPGVRSVSSEVFFSPLRHFLPHDPPRTFFLLFGSMRTSESPYHHVDGDGNLEHLRFFLLPRCTMLWFLSMRTSLEMALPSQINYERQLGSFCYSEHVCLLSCFSCVLLFATLWTVAHQARLSMGLSRQEYWSGLPWDIPPGIFLLQGYSWPRDQTHNSYAFHTGRQVLFFNRQVLHH